MKRLRWKKIKLFIEFIHILALGQFLPGFLFFENFAPPILPNDIIFIILCVLFLIGFLIAYNMIYKLDTQYKAKVFLIIAGLLIGFYVVLFKTTTIIWPGTNEIVQVGFGTYNFSLTKNALKMKEYCPDPSTKESLMDCIGYEKGNVKKIWTPWSVNISGILLMVIFIPAFFCWSLGWSMLTTYLVPKEE